MDEAFVVLVATQHVCQAFPFATKAGAEQAKQWITAAYGGEGAVHTGLIDDHEPVEHEHGEPIDDLPAAGTHIHDDEPKPAPAPAPVGRPGPLRPPQHKK